MKGSSFFGYFPHISATKELNCLLHDCYTGAPSSKCGGNVSRVIFGVNKHDSNFQKKISTNQSRLSVRTALIGWKFDIPRNFALIGWKKWHMLNDGKVFFYIWISLLMDLVKWIVQWEQRMLPLVEKSDINRHITSFCQQRPTLTDQEVLAWHHLL